MKERERVSALHTRRFENKKQKTKKDREREERRILVLGLSCLLGDRPMIRLHVYTGLRRSQFEESGKLGRIDDAGHVGPI